LQKAIYINSIKSDKRHRKKLLREKTRRLDAGEDESDSLEAVKEAKVDDK